MARMYVSILLSVSFGQRFYKKVHWRSCSGGGRLSGRVFVGREARVKIHVEIKPNLSARWICAIVLKYDENLPKPLFCPGSVFVLYWYQFHNIRFTSSINYSVLVTLGFFFDRYISIHHFSIIHMSTWLHQQRRMIYPPHNNTVT